MKAQPIRTVQPLTVMLVDDDEDEYVIMQDLIVAIPTMEIEIDHVTTYADALRAIELDRHDVYLIDYRLGAHSGLDLVREAIRGGCTRPLFILTGQGDHDIDVQASELGAAGYLEKRVLTSVTLERAIRFGLGSRRLAPASHRTATRPGDLQLQIALARGATVREAAKAAGVAERTAHRRLADPAFRSEVDGLREELRLKIVEQVAAQLSGEQFAASESEGSSSQA